MMDQSVTSRRRKLGKELRVLRERHGLTIERVAEHLECSHPKISRIELGKQAIRKLDLRMLLDLYEVADAAERAAFTALATGAASQRSWFVPYNDVLPPKFDTYLDLEADATALYYYGNSIIHGLLQTEDYARALISAYRRDYSTERIDRLVGLRMDRQAVLERSRPPALWIILDEAVLRRPVGDATVMARQLTHLVTLSSRPDITVQLLPLHTGVHAAIGGAFTIIKLREANDVLYVDSVAGNLYLEEPEVVEARELMFNHLRAEALPPAESAALITTIAKELA